jgi:xylulokinase
MCPKDYVRYRLTGEFAIDVQEASGTLLLDVTHRRWSKEVAEAAGIPESWLPKVYESPEVCARISDKAAGLTGLAAGTPSPPEQATRAQAPWAWASCSRARSRPPSALPA